MSHDTFYNHLRDEDSIYLKNRAKDPIQWFPYSPIALQKAKEENKPIFLSIGHNSCHWCQTMNEESFKDKSIAHAINQNFIAIKVDKEEFPDIDQYFQLAGQVMSGKGGWPLNIFLTPQMKPYFIGTYFPPIQAENSPSFFEVISNLSKAYKEDFETVTKNANQVVETLKLPPIVENKVQFEGHFPGPSAILNALKNYQDEEAGGYGGVPKFPHYSFYEWAIEQMLEGVVSTEYGTHIIKSVESMLMGGLYDHVKGGVHRHCTDQNWTRPQFEKMLYDQAGLLRLLAKMSLIYPSPLILDGIIQTIDFINTEMLSDEGYFFSSQNSQSEGIEGLYFTFTQDEFLDSLAQFDESLLDDQEQLIKWFNITEEGELGNNLNVIQLNPKFKEEFYSPTGWEKVRKVRQALLEARKMRFPPTTDSKGVAAWNFSLLSSLLDVIQYCKINAITDAANDLFSKVNHKIQKTFLQINEDGVTNIITTTTRNRQIPLFEDYTFYADYCFRAYEILGNPDFLENAQNTIKYIFKAFFQNNAFFTRATDYSDSEEFYNIHTPIFDHSYRCALATLIINLRKWRTVFKDDQEYLNQMDSIIENLTHLSLQNPLAFGETLRALTYPDMAYRKIKVPYKWLKEKTFHPFFQNFSSRFALYYHQDDDDSWEISTLEEVELQGRGLEEFAQVFKRPQEDQA